tara:strand:+ start:356 stop:946 length:591 start_codon:yes stop_codon:yes gene_type:complete
MPCNHRFIQDLYPNHNLKYLFIGTFNPEWDSPKGNDANWFYGRYTNSFWKILPETFGHPNLNIINNRQNPKPWKDYCIKNGIGLTDIIQTIKDAKEEEHKTEILGFQDKHLERFNEVIFTDISNLIIRNSETLYGVYLTRYCHTLRKNGIFYKRWTEIENLCKQNGIHYSCLISPSNGCRVSIAEKVKIWQMKINK